MFPQADLRTFAIAGPRLNEDAKRAHGEHDGGGRVGHLLPLLFEVFLVANAVGGKPEQAAAKASATACQTKSELTQLR